MKKFLCLICLAAILGCSSDDSDAPVDPTDDIVKELPEAVDDEFNTIEDTEFKITGLLDNDIVPTGTRLKEFDTETVAGGEIVDNRDGSFTYRPVDNFTGEDSFTYTICDKEGNCSTATVKLIVQDTGSPKAVDDVVIGVTGVTIIIDDLTDNDDLIDGAKITSVENGENGTVVLNGDQTVSFTPAADFQGEANFTYTICDDDETPSCSTATVTVKISEPLAFNIPAELQEYYKNTVFSANSEITKESITDLTIDMHTTILTYFQRHDYLYSADADPDNQDDVILMYSGERRYWQEYTSSSNSYSPQTFNTEHIYPQSRLSSEDAVTDLHHLRSADASINSLRLNYPYADGNGEYGLVGNNEQWYPGDDWKGDVARMIFYLNIRYGESFDNVGGLDLFLKWNVEDPVSEFEMQRNNVIEAAQGNRNPFIDNPYLVTLIWGGSDAENRWE
ncbi:endonuclease [Zunongwangia pacifica]|uniref:Endonuclease n=1 Tax=Zunongwangia pacifica TaxID=2911062 RepID=A0A9X1ZWC7_9FLAO|nr:endonuclease [Zunongwangia pacifica]MCL6219658.1 endonuclease [Zunongwangia pacifica]